MKTFQQYFEEKEKTPKKNVKIRSPLSHLTYLKFNSSKFKSDKDYNRKSKTQKNDPTKNY